MCKKSASYKPSQKGEFHYSEALLEGGGISLVQNSKQVILHIEEEAMSLLVVTIVFAVVLVTVTILTHLHVVCQHFICLSSCHCFKAMSLVVILP